MVHLLEPARSALHDEPYAAAFIVKTVLEASGLVEGYSYWTFSDIFEENYFPSVPFHGGFGLMNLHGIAKPAYRAFEMLHGLGTEILPMEGIHETVDGWCVRDANSVTVLISPTSPCRAIRSRPRPCMSSSGNAPQPPARPSSASMLDMPTPRALWSDDGQAPNI